MRMGVLYDRLAADGDFAGLCAHAETADQLGIDSLWLDERRGAPGGLGGVPLVLTALSQRTRVLRVGGLAALGLDNPVRVAEQAAMVDLFSGGRLDFGATRGDGVADPAGRTIPAAEATARLAEALALVVAAWTTDGFSFVGRHYRFPAHVTAPAGVRVRPFDPDTYRPQWTRGAALAETLAITPKPLQRPRPPVFVLATDDATATLAGAGGHALVCPPADDATIARRVQAWRAALGVRAADRHAELVLLVDGFPTASSADVVRRLHRLHALVQMNQVVFPMPPPTPDGVAALTRIVAEVAPHVQA